MDVSWFLLLVSAAILIAIVLLAMMCLDCRNKGPLRSITQSTSDEYVPSGFMVIHPPQPTPSQNPGHIPTSPSDPHLRPFSNSTKPQPRPYTPTETESNPSYENPAPDAVEEPDDPADGYIEVIPDNVACPTNQSRASTPSSDHNYVNLDSENEDKSDYLNVDPRHYPVIKPDIFPQSSSSDDEEDEDYVNQPISC